MHTRRRVVARRRGSGTHSGRVIISVRSVPRRYGNFDIIFGLFPSSLSSHPFSSSFFPCMIRAAQQYRCCVWVLIGACDPMSFPIFHMNVCVSRRSTRVSTSERAGSVSTKPASAAPIARKYSLQATVRTSNSNRCGDGGGCGGCGSGRWWKWSVVGGRWLSVVVVVVVVVVGDGRGWWWWWLWLWKWN